MAPGPALQRINAILHSEPLASVVYSLYWSCILCLVVPFSAIALLPLCIYRILASWWFLDWNGAKAYDPAAWKQPNDITELAVVVTGCDSGFGKELALWAAEAGYVVFAGCLKKESFAQFDVMVGSSGGEHSGKVIPLVLDVTDNKNVDDAAAAVSKWLADTAETEGDGKQHRILHGLVNNAGIMILGLFDWLDVSDYQKVMDVNFYGILRCCKAFLPILKHQSIEQQYKGSRIINVTSIAGIMPGNPVGSAYAASKHAAQVLTEALRKELMVFDIGVSSVNPSFHNTNMIAEVETGQDTMRTWNKMSTELQQEYGTGVRDAIIEVGRDMSTSLCWNLEVVVNEVIKALKARDIPGQILVGTDAKYLIPLLRMLPSWLLAMNQKDERIVPAIMNKSDLLK